MPFGLVEGFLLAPRWGQTPKQPQPTEAVYLRKLLDAYEQHVGAGLSDHKDVSAHPLLAAHLNDSRNEFFSAEALHRFSRDTLPPGAYEALQNEMLDGIRDDLRASHSDGYRRIVAVTKTARQLQITSHPLVPRMAVRDRGGICHQLANGDVVSWTS